MTNDKLVSIIIPVYNASRFLEETINSIQEQTYSNWEAIFIDDCSSDNSYNLIITQLYPKILFILGGQNYGLFFSTRCRGNCHHRSTEDS